MRVKHMDSPQSTAVPSATLISASLVSYKTVKVCWCQDGDEAVVVYHEDANIESQLLRSTYVSAPLRYPHCMNADLYRVHLQLSLTESVRGGVVVDEVDKLR